MYQIEFRPGWRWMRDFKKFNASMRDEEGRFGFNGPYCRIKDWIELSREIGADYHILEIKWHDGICWFKTSLTEWRTPVDYAGRFAEGSRRAGIPFMFYYSSVIDHNPQFD
jgi:alpha-L-fucosidase